MHTLFNAQTYKKLDVWIDVLDYYNKICIYGCNKIASHREWGYFCV